MKSTLIENNACTISLEQKELNHLSFILLAEFSHTGYPFNDGHEKSCYKIFVDVHSSGSFLNKFEFSYHVPIDTVIDTNFYEFALYCFLSDATSFLNTEDILDFANEFGYELDDEYKRNQLKRIYEACEDSADILKNIFSEDNIFEILNEIGENQ